MFNIILVGPPGSGKGTQAKRMIQKYGFIPIALGALLRQQMVENGTNKRLIEPYINSGQLVPDHLSFELVKQLVQAQPADASFLFDGFPRTLAQVTFLTHFLKQCNAQIDGVIFLDVPHEVLLKRLKNRAAIESRPDDQDNNKIKTRMQIYEQETLPMVNHYKSEGKLYSIDGTKDVDAVTQSIESIMDRLRP
ncbi:MAG: adenylate kinase [Candidatus Cardinium sp.]|uniref:adenylate kinase n=1 Tax=Candidatus Cardinium sp. TP TaxID=2961955 RepID=UPI0021B02270|nr:adenylate kinase [Candidatus Cardinium sp. TP]MCT4696913.1 adenylate kinase [Candidatus Cardinium sp. TP]MDN5246857.1 adenylate kinase [Candidatus Cardinium sp.]